MPSSDIPAASARAFTTSQLTDQRAGLTNVNGQRTQSYRDPSNLVVFRG